MFRLAHHGRAFALTLPLVILPLAPSATFAADFCIDAAPYAGYFTATDPELILENFKLPRKGKCRVFTGVGHVDVFRSSVIQGAACTTSSGDRVNFTLSVGEMPDIDNFVFLPGRVERFNVVLAMPALAGRISHYLDDRTTSNVAASGYVCKNTFIP